VAVHPSRDERDRRAISTNPLGQNGCGLFPVSINLR
jgi:hypothetical protein